jgi:hypothetical protein
MKTISEMLDERATERRRSTGKPGTIRRWLAAILLAIGIASILIPILDKAIAQAAYDAVHARQMGAW